MCFTVCVVLLLCVRMSGLLLYRYKYVGGQSRCGMITMVSFVICGGIGLGCVCLSDLMSR